MRKRHRDWGFLFYMRNIKFCISERSIQKEREHDLSPPHQRLTKKPPNNNDRGSPYLILLVAKLLTFGLLTTKRIYDGS